MKTISNIIIHRTIVLSLRMSSLLLFNTNASQLSFMKKAYSFHRLNESAQIEVLPELSAIKNLLVLSEKSFHRILSINILPKDLIGRTESLFKLILVIIYSI